MKIIITVIALNLLTANNSYAICKCVCINRQSSQICENQFDFPANCSLHRC